MAIESSMQWQYMYDEKCTQKTNTKTTTQNEQYTRTHTQSCKDP